MKTGKCATVIFAGIIGLTLLAGAAFAQGAPGKDVGGKGMGIGQQIADDLNLTEEQKEKLKAVHEEMRPKMQEIRQGVSDGKITRDEARQKLQALREELQQKISSILTPEQQEKVKQKLQEFRDRRGKDGRGKSADAMGMLGRLNLTQEQKEEVRPLLQEHRDAMKSLRDQEKAGTITKEQMQEKARALRQDLVGKLNDNLTAEQKQKIQDWMKNRPDPGKGPKTDKPGKGPKPDKKKDK